MSGADDGRALVERVVDTGSFVVWDEEVRSSDRLGFVDVRPYRDRLALARRRSDATEAVLGGSARWAGHDVVVVASDYRFLAGTQGTAAGERITRAFERAARLAVPVVALPRSAGTRMQEGTLAFVQMAKIAAAVQRYKEAGGFLVSYLRGPTLGGALASWGGLAHVTFAEPGARIGLVGPRVRDAVAGAPPAPRDSGSAGRDPAGVVDAMIPVEHLRERVARVLAVASEPPPSAGTDTAVDPVQERDAWSSVTATRAPDRAGVRELLDRWARDVTFLRGDGTGREESACLVALCRFAGIPVVLVGADRRPGERGASLGAVGYRKVRRAADTAAQLRVPLVTAIDTRGARMDDPAGDDVLAREIAHCLATLATVPVPTVSLLLGEGAGGGALALLPADRILAAEAAWLAPLAPEGVAAILFRDVRCAPQAARAQAITAVELERNGIVDRVVGGAHGAALVDRMGAAVAAELQDLRRCPVEGLVGARLARLRHWGEPA